MMKKNAIAMLTTLLATISLTMSVSAGEFSNALQAYYDFEFFTPGNNPEGLPTQNNDGSFADLSGNGNTLYVTDVDVSASEAYVPQDNTGGLFGGGAFYSSSQPANDAEGTIGVIENQDVGTYDNQNFTISMWEKSLFRSTENDWVPGAGRSVLFMKAPDASEIAAETTEGFSLQFERGSFKHRSNSTDNFGQSDNASIAHDAWDSNEWAHFAMTATYDEPNNEYDIQVYANGTALTGAFADLSLPEDVIETTGYMTLGSFWRGDSYPTQRILSWQMTSLPTDSNIGEAWIDEFAIFERAFSAAEVAATANLANNDTLQYDMGDVTKLFDAYADGASGMEMVGTLLWSYSDTLTGTAGEVTGAGDNWQVVLDDTGGAGASVGVFSVLPVQKISVSSGSWFAGANWDPTGAPGGLDIATVALIDTVSVDTNNASAFRLTVNGQLNIDAARELYVSDAAGVGSDGGLTVNGTLTASSLVAAGISSIGPGGAIALIN